MPKKSAFQAIIFKMAQKKSWILAPFFLACLMVLVMQMQWWSAQRETMFPQASVKTLDCPHCNGVGLFISEGTTNRVLCAICFGVGNHRVRVRPPAEHVCIVCSGMGRIYDPETAVARFCQRCGGRGAIRESASADAEAPITNAMGTSLIRHPAPGALLVPR